MYVHIYIYTHTYTYTYIHMQTVLFITELIKRVHRFATA